MTSVPGARAGGDAVVAEEDGFDVGRVRDADDDDVAGARHVGGRGSLGRAERHEVGRRPGVRFQTVSSKPALRRLAAIAAPIVPSPQNPTRSGTRKW